MIGLALGQQSWLRLLNIDHHEVMAGTDASMAPGFETLGALKATKASSGLLGESQSAALKCNQI
jgi:hypothetical protein